MLGCVLLVPNGALWAVAYAAGPGFTVGAGTGVSPFGATLGPVPALPLLAALPGDGTPPPAVRAVLLLPVLAGVLTGWVLGRRLAVPDPAGPTAGTATAEPAGWFAAALSARAARAALRGLAAGAIAALVAAVLAALAGGALGPGYLAAVGPSAWRVALALAVEMAVPAALTAALVPSRPTPGPPARTAEKPAVGGSREAHGRGGWGRAPGAGDRDRRDVGGRDRREAGGRDVGGRGRRDARGRWARGRRTAPAGAGRPVATGAQVRSRAGGSRRTPAS